MNVAHTTLLVSKARTATTAQTTANLLLILLLMLLFDPEVSSPLEEEDSLSISLRLIDYKALIAKLRESAWHREKQISTTIALAKEQELRPSRKRKDCWQRILPCS